MTRPEDLSLASEITAQVSLSAFKATVMSSAVGRSMPSTLFTMTGNFHSEGTILVATSGTVIPMGQVTTPHWAFLRNLDLTNYVTVRNGASGADVLRLLAGEFAVCPLDPTGDFRAVANTTACYLEYLILSA